MGKCFFGEIWNSRISKFWKPHPSTFWIFGIQDSLFFCELEMMNPVFEFLKFRNPGCLLIRNDDSTFWIFEIQHSWNFDNWKWWILENDEKSKTRNLLTSILLVEFLEKLGYELVSIKKHESILCKNRTSFSIFGEGNPYHQFYVYFNKPTYKNKHKTTIPELLSF